MMQPGHEECGGEVIDEKVMCEPDARQTVLCFHDHKEPIFIDEDLSPETVGWHCHCCGRVWVDETYVRGQ